jgi:hypothetical protein
VPTRPTLRRRLAAAAAVTALAVVALPAFPAAAATGGYVRLAHLSPDTPAVDVYLKSDSGSVDQTFPGVAYGAMSDYLRLPAGRYSVAMRKAGADPSTKPVLTTQLGVEQSAAYTVAGVGRYADLGLRVLEDDLTLPGAGESKVRIIQASVRAPVLDVGVNDGPAIADGVQFATTTPYREVKPGKWTVRVQPSGGGVSSTLPGACTRCSSSTRRTAVSSPNCTSTPGARAPSRRAAWPPATAAPSPARRCRRRCWSRASRRC